MIIDCIADLHGHYPELEGGDPLIVAGDLTTNDRDYGWDCFYEWLARQNYMKKVYIGGNHDNRLHETKDMTPKHCDAHYLCDSGTEFEGLKIWGSPWTSQFPGINPKCCAFTRPFMASLKDRWDLIPDDTDILITHGPPNGILDMVKTEYSAHVGDMDLKEALNRIRPKLHVYGHIHEGYGQYQPILDLGPRIEPLRGYPIFVNCSHVNEHYEPVNKPIRIIL